MAVIFHLFKILNIIYCSTIAHLQLIRSSIKVVFNFGVYHHSKISLSSTGVKPVVEYTKKVTTSLDGQAGGWNNQN